LDERARAEGEREREREREQPPDARVVFRVRLFCVEDHEEEKRVW
jgi:hypothetical protein